MAKLKVFSIFTGVGGFELGLDKENFDIIGLCENNKFKQSVLRYHFEDIPILDNILKFDSNSIEDFDILVGGFPCKGISTQGKQDALKNPETALFYEIPKILKAKQPKYFLLENVSNLFAIDKGEPYAEIQRELEESGYNVSATILDSSKFGTSQQRLRAFIFGNRRGISMGEISYLDGYKGTHKIKDPKIISWSKSTREKHYDVRIRTDGLVNTLTTGTGCNGASSGNFVIENNKFRKLLVKECEMLMGWPENWTRLGRKENGMIVPLTNSQRYKMCGDGVVPNCVRAASKLFLMGN